MLRDARSHAGNMQLSERVDCPMCVAASTAAHSGRTEGTVDSRHQRKLSLGARVCVGDVRVHRVSPRLARQAIVTCKDVLRQRSDRARTGGMCV